MRLLCGRAACAPHYKQGVWLSRINNVLQLNILRPFLGYARAREFVSPWGASHRRHQTSPAASPQEAPAPSKPATSAQKPAPATGLGLRRVRLPFVDVPGGI